MDSNHSLISNALLFSFKDSQNIFLLIKILLHVGLSIFNLSGSFDPNSTTDKENAIKQITPEINESMDIWLNIARSIATLKGFFFSFSKNLETVIKACESNDLIVVNLQSKSLIDLIDSIQNDLNEHTKKLFALNEQSSSFLPENILLKIADLFRSNAIDIERKNIEEFNAEMAIFYNEFLEFIKSNNIQKMQMVEQRSHFQSEEVLLENNYQFLAKDLSDIQAEIAHLENLSKTTMDHIQTIKDEQNSLRINEENNYKQKMNSLLYDYQETIKRKTKEWQDYIDKIDANHDELSQIYLKMPDEITYTEVDFSYLFFIRSKTISKTNFEKIKVKYAMEEVYSLKKRAEYSRDEFFVRLKSNFDNNSSYLTNKYQQNSSSNAQATNLTFNDLKKQGNSFNTMKNKLWTEKQELEHIISKLLSEKTKASGEIKLLEKQEKDLFHDFEIQSGKYSTKTEELQIKIQESKRKINENIKNTGHFLDTIALQYIEQVTLFYILATELSISLSYFKSFCEGFKSNLSIERDYFIGLFSKNFELDELVKFGFQYAWFEKVFSNNVEFQKTIIQKYDSFKKIITFFDNSQNKEIEEEFHLSSLQRITLKNKLKSLTETETCNFKKGEIVKFCRKFLELTAFQEG